MHFVTQAVIFDLPSCINPCCDVVAACIELWCIEAELAELQNKPLQDSILLERQRLAALHHRLFSCTGQQSCAPAELHYDGKNCNANSYVSHFAWRFSALSVWCENGVSKGLRGCTADSKVDLESFLWAHCLVRSRALDLPFAQVMFGRFFSCICSPSGAHGHVCLLHS